jgi:hypothetical protein
MKRDFELIHELLSELEDSNDGLAISELYVDDQRIQEHAVLLIEAGLAHGINTKVTDGDWDVFLERLTWAGHDFIAATNDKTIWMKAKDVIFERGGAVTFDILLAWLKQEAARKLGLPG